MTGPPVPLANGEVGEQACRPAAQPSNMGRCRGAPPPSQPLGALDR
jgi:hypothetical protein